MSKKVNLDSQAVLDGISDEQLAALAPLMSMPWQYGEPGTAVKDPDGYKADLLEVDKEPQDRAILQSICWSKFNTNPFMNTSVRGLAGRINGSGFDISSEIMDIQDVIDEIYYDPRNRLYNYLHKYVVRSIIEGELFLMASVHTDGFVEIDFVDPLAISSDTDGGNIHEGIIYHPKKPTLPLFYNIDDGNGNISQVPSIFCARYPELFDLAKKNPAWKSKYASKNKSRKKAYKDLGGYQRFMIHWDKGFVTKRNVSHLRTVLEWLNHYEDLKKYEIDHKKSSGAYVWTFEFEDMRAFRLWLSLSDEEKRKTAMMAKMEPGTRLILPPGITCKAVNPQLPRISDTDTDILHMVTAGVNEPEDISTGQSKGTFASVKESRGPMSDRVSDEVEYFRRFLVYDFWGAIFFLRSIVSDFPRSFKVREAVGFKSQKPQFKEVSRPPERLLEVSFPTSEIVDYESRAKAFLGVKHGSTFDTLGIPNTVIAGKLGINNYAQMRKKAATEEDKYPELIPNEDQESVQERREAEPPKKPKPLKKKGA